VVVAHLEMLNEALCELRQRRCGLALHDACPFVRQVCEENILEDFALLSVSVFVER